MKFKSRHFSFQFVKVFLHLFKKSSCRLHIASNYFPFGWDSAIHHTYTEKENVADWTHYGKFFLTKVAWAGYKVLALILKKVLYLFNISWLCKLSHSKFDLISWSFLFPELKNRCINFLKLITRNSKRTMFLV